MDKNTIYRRCVVSPTADGKYRVESDFVYKDIRVPAQDITNGANIPRFFWQIIPPFQPSLLPAVIIHDYLCIKEEYKKADDIFEEILEVMEVAKWKRLVLVKSVRAYHKLRYKI